MPGDLLAIRVGDAKYIYSDYSYIDLVILMRLVISMIGFILDGFGVGATRNISGLLGTIGIGGHVAIGLSTRIYLGYLG